MAGGIFDPGGAFGDNPLALPSVPGSVSVLPGTGSFPTFPVGPAPRLVSAFRDSQGRVSLAFRWPDAVPEAGYTLARYEVLIWANGERTSILPGGTMQSVSAPTASFTGIPSGAAFLFEVVAVGSGGQRSDPLRLVATSAGVGAAPALPANSPSPPVEEDTPATLFGLRATYGNVEGVKRWARIVTFGNAPGQVSNLDILYFLMGASDIIDSYLEGMYYVPLLKYTTGTDAIERYPPNIVFQSERLAAGLLIQSRKSILTENEASYATALENRATRDIERMSTSMSLPGQSMSSGFTPYVYNSNPRQFAMPGDAAGTAWNPATGSPDMRSFRVSQLPYSQTSWRYGGGFWLG